MPITQKLRKWHFLFLGGVLIFLSFYLWYWNWLTIGIPNPLQPEHWITIFSFIVGLFVWGVFIYLLTRRQVAIMLVWMILVNLLAALGTFWMFRTYPAFFDLLRPISMDAYEPEYINLWRDSFLTPMLYLIHGGMLLLWLMALVMFLVRKPTDEPE